MTTSNPPGRVRGWRRAAAPALPCMLALLAVACGPAARATPEATAIVRIELVAGSGGPPLSRVHVDVAPAGASLDLAPDAGQWTATVVVRAGVAQTLTATAWSGSTAVGSSTATVTTAQHATALVSMTILDTSQRPAGADHGPVVTAVTSSVMKPTSGVPVTLTMTAVDPDRDPMTYSWRDSCAGTFSAQARTTTWTPKGTGWCTVTASATARGVTGSLGMRINVAARPNVTIEEDLAYVNSGDGLSTYPYALTNATFGELTSEDTIAFTSAYDEVRLVRYVVSNGGTTPVAVEPVNLLGAWELVESWVPVATATSTGTLTTGATCSALADTYSLTPSCSVGEAFAGAFGDPAVLGSACNTSVEPANELATRQSAAVTSRAYDLAPDGTDAAEASLISGKYVVPAAVSGVPGKIALYLVRPVVSGRTVPSPVWNGSAWVLTQYVWQKLNEPTWTGACPDSSEPGESGATWGEYQWRHQVDGAEDWLSGAFTLTAYSTSGGALQGGAVAIQDVDITRVIAH